MPTDKRLRKKEGRQARLEAARAEARRQQRNRRLISLVIAAAVVVAVLALLAGGGGDDDKETASGDSPGKTTTSIDQVTSTTVKVPEGLTKPTIAPPKGPAPATLVKQDLTVGTGAEAKAGDTVTIHYVGVLYEGGKQFDASWDGDGPATFDLDQLIPGWQQGIPGMKVGGRRQLIIPPELGYGAQGAGADIPPNAPLIFVIDLLGVGE